MSRHAFSYEDCTRHTKVDGQHVISEAISFPRTYDAVGLPSP